MTRSVVSAGDGRDRAPLLDQGVGSIHILGKLAAGDLLRAVREPGSVGTTLVA